MARTDSQSRASVRLATSHSNSIVHAIHGDPASSPRGHILVQRGALHVPTCPTNLLSVAQITDAGHTKSSVSAMRQEFIEKGGTLFPDTDIVGGLKGSIGEGTEMGGGRTIR